ncbi:hypothetical protein SRHO_G00262820 [Serrasalmus rhombeus]
MAGGQCPPEYPLYTASSRLKRLDTGSLHTHPYIVARFSPDFTCLIRTDDASSSESEHEKVSPKAVMRLGG